MQQNLYKKFGYVFSCNVEKNSCEKSFRLSDEHLFLFLSQAGAFSRDPIKFARGWFL